MSQQHAAVDAAEGTRRKKPSSLRAEIILSIEDEGLKTLRGTTSFAVFPTAALKRTGSIRMPIRCPVTWAIRPALLEVDVPLGSRRLLAGEGSLFLATVLHLK